MVKFVIFIFLIVTNTAFADDVIWESGWTNELAPWSGIQESGKTTKTQVAQDAKEEESPQSDQKRSEPASLFNAQDDTQRDADPTQQGKGNIHPDEQGSEWYATPLTIFLLTVIGVVVSYYFGYRQVYYARRADIRDERNAIESGLLEQKRERAFLAVEHCQMSPLPTKEGLSLSCVLRNVGRTQATLVEYDLHTDLVSNLPPLPDYRNLPKTDIRGVPLGAGSDLTVKATDLIIPLSREMLDQSLKASSVDLTKVPPDHKENVLNLIAALSVPVPSNLIEHGLKTGPLRLYFYGCFAYIDAFDLRHEVAFCTWYDPKQNIFMLVNEPGYNYST